MNAMLAKQEAMRDNEAGYRNRVRNAKLCTVMAVVFGVVVITSVAMVSNKLIRKYKRNYMWNQRCIDY